MRRAVLGWLVIGLLTSACAPSSAQSGATTSPSRSPSATPSQDVSAPIATATPSPRLVTFPDLPFLVGTASGDLYFALANGVPAGRSVHVCGSAIVKIVADDRSALLFCERPKGELDLYLWEATGVTHVASDAIVSGAARTTDGVVYATIGRYEETAPISMTKLVRKDLRTGAVTTIDERYGVAFDIRPTDGGVAVWRPKNSLSFARPDVETGTWVLRGTTLTKLSQYRLVDGRRDRWVFESEPIDPAMGYFTSSFCCTQVFASEGGAERRISPLDVPNEKALAMLDDGRVVTWRSSDEYADGKVVIYQGTTVSRTDIGPFGYFEPMHSGDWIVVQTPYATTTTLRAYRVSDGAFAGTTMSGVRSLAMLAPR